MEQAQSLSAFLAVIVIVEFLILLTGFVLGMWCSSRLSATRKPCRAEGAQVFYLPENDRAVHLSRDCEHLQGARNVKLRLKSRRLCLTCVAAPAPHLRRRRQ